LRFMNLLQIPNYIRREIAVERSSPPNSL
jgi:hypothetical protein